MNITRLGSPLKYLYKDEVGSHKVWIGPARGEEIIVNPRDKMYMLFGLHEPEIAPTVGRLVQDGGTLVDVGAGIGYYTLVMEGHADEVHAFEPNSEKAERIKAVTKDVTVHEEAIGPGDSLDDIVPSFDGIKVDVEGDEVAVLKGATLGLENASWAIVEVHGAELERECRKILEGVGLDVERIDQSTRWYRSSTDRNMERGWLIARRGRTRTTSREG